MLNYRFFAKLNLGFILKHTRFLTVTKSTFLSEDFFRLLAKTNVLSYFRIKTLM